MPTLKDQIKRELKAKGVTQTQLAKILKVCPVSVHDVVSGKKGTVRIRAAISLAVGKKIDEIWPNSKKQ